MSTLRIEISRYKSIVEALQKPKVVRRIIGSILLLGVLLFVGITVITITVKRMYPYSDIRTNALGATTVRDESTEVTYWLFSTSELWANSGIKVEKGDVLTIRSSGRTYTAIHHLYDSARDNSRLSHEWLDSEGRMRSGNNMLDGANRLRAEYRIFPNKQQNALIMQVVDDAPAKVCTPENISRFYYIGSERSEIRINDSGILYFAVNDIVLTQEVIYRMTVRNLGIIAELMREHGFKDSGSFADSVFKPAESWLACFDRSEAGYRDCVDGSDVCDGRGIRGVRESAESVFKYRIGVLHDSVLRWVKDDSIVRTREYQRCLDDERTFRFGMYSGGNRDTLKTEMNYYSEENYDNAWFDDNIGSLLIVIERKN